MNKDLDWEQAFELIFGDTSPESKAWSFWKLGDISAESKKAILKIFINYLIKIALVEKEKGKD